MSGAIPIAATLTAGSALAYCYFVLRRSEVNDVHDFLKDESDDELTRVAYTSRWVAAERAMESARPDALFVDPYAAALGGSSGQKLSAKMNGTISQTCFQDYHIVWMAVRTKFIDDRLIAFARQHGAKAQYVSLGSGLDARIYRLRGLEDMRAAFEVDLPEVGAAFGRAMTRLGARAPCPRAALSIDLTQSEEALPRALRAAGFSDTLPTFWLLEGLTMYLPAEVNAQLVRSMAQLSPSGSQLCVGFIADASKLPQQAKPVYAPPIPEFSALLRAHDWAGELQVDRFGDARLNFGRYPAGTPPDAMQCFALCDK